MEITSVLFTPHKPTGSLYLFYLQILFTGLWLCSMLVHGTIDLIKLQFQEETTGLIGFYRSDFTSLQPVRDLVLFLHSQSIWN